MRSVILFLTLSAIVSAPAAAQVKVNPGSGIAQPSASPGPRIGDAAPAWSLSESVSGRPAAELTPEALKGKTIVLEFWATWCGPCITAMPHLEELAAATRSDGVVILAISSDARAKIEGHASRHTSINFLRDTADATFLAYQPRTVPHSVVIGPDGKIKAITEPQNLTAESLRTVARGGAIDLPLKGGRAANLEWDLTPPFNPDAKEPDSQAIIEPTSCQGGGSRRKPGGRSFTADGALAVNLISAAYGVSPRRMDVDLPPTLSGQQFRASVWVPTGKEATLLDALKAAIAQHLPVTASWEKRAREVYLLRQAEGGGGAKLTKSDAKPSFSMLRGKIESKASPIERLASTLENFSSLPVIDDTGLTDRYDFQLEYDPADPKALRQQLTDRLGLIMVKETREVDTLVVRSRP